MTVIVAALIMIVQSVSAPVSTPDSVREQAEAAPPETAAAPSLTRPLPAGAIIAAGDLYSAGAIGEHDSSLHPLIGKQTRRYLPRGAAVRAADIREPMLVTRNSVVRIAFERGPLTIAATGRALSDGALGETIRVLNLTSKTTIAAVVVEQGLVKIP